MRLKLNISLVGNRKKRENMLEDDGEDKTRQILSRGFRDPGKEIASFAKGRCFDIFLSRTPRYWGWLNYYNFPQSYDHKPYTTHPLSNLYPYSTIASFNPYPPPERSNYAGRHYGCPTCSPDYREMFMETAQSRKAKDIKWLRSPHIRSQSNESKSLITESDHRSKIRHKSQSVESLIIKGHSKENQETQTRCYSAHSSKSSGHSYCNCSQPFMYHCHDTSTDNVETSANFYEIEYSDEECANCGVPVKVMRCDNCGDIVSDDESALPYTVHKNVVVFTAECEQGSAAKSNEVKDSAKKSPRGRLLLKEKSGKDCVDLKEKSESKKIEQVKPKGKKFSSSVDLCTGCLHRIDSKSVLAHRSKNLQKNDEDRAKSVTAALETKSQIDPFFHRETKLSHGRRIIIAKSLSEGSVDKNIKRKSKCGNELPTINESKVEELKKTVDTKVGSSTSESTYGMFHEGKKMFENAINEIKMIKEMCEKNESERGLSKSSEPTENLSVSIENEPRVESRSILNTVLDKFDDIVLKQTPLTKSQERVISKDSESMDNLKVEILRRGGNKSMLQRIKSGLLKLPNFENALAAMYDNHENPYVFMANLDKTEKKTFIGGVNLSQKWKQSFLELPQGVQKGVLKGTRLDGSFDLEPKSVDIQDFGTSDGNEEKATASDESDPGEGTSYERPTEIETEEVITQMPKFVRDIQKAESVEDLRVPPPLAPSRVFDAVVKFMNPTVPKPHPLEKNIKKLRSHIRPVRPFKEEKPQIEEDESLFKTTSSLLTRLFSIGGGSENQTTSKPSSITVKNTVSQTVQTTLIQDKKEKSTCTPGVSDKKHVFHSNKNVAEDDLMSQLRELVHRFQPVNKNDVATVTSPPLSGSEGGSSGKKKPEPKKRTPSPPPPDVEKLMKILLQNVESKGKTPADENHCNVTVCPHGKSFTVGDNSESQKMNLPDNYKLVMCPHGSCFDLVETNTNQFCNYEARCFHRKPLLTDRFRKKNPDFTMNPAMFYEDVKRRNAYATSDRVSTRDAIRIIDEYSLNYDPRRRDTQVYTCLTDGGECDVDDEEVSTEVTNWTCYCASSTSTESTTTVEYEQKHHIDDIFPGVSKELTVNRDVDVVSMLSHICGIAHPMMATLDNLQADLDKGAKARGDLGKRDDGKGGFNMALLTAKLQRDVKKLDEELESKRELVGDLRNRIRLEKIELDKEETRLTARMGNLEKIHS